MAARWWVAAESLHVQPLRPGRNRPASERVRAVANRSCAWLVSPAEWAGDWPARYWIHQIHRSVDLVFEQECRACAAWALCSPTPARRADAYPPHVGGVIGQQAPEFLEAALGAERALQIGGRFGSAETVALGVTATGVDQELHVLGTLNPFGDHFQPETLSEADDRPADDRRVGILGHSGDEAAIDLEQMQRKPLQVTERTVTRAEIVQRQAYTEVGDLLQRGHHRIAVLHQQGFGDLQHQPGRRQPRFVQYRDQAVGEVGLLQLANRQINRAVELRLAQ